jgi:hypothetical protein
MQRCAPSLARRRSCMACMQRSSWRACLLRQCRCTASTCPVLQHGADCCLTTFRAPGQSMCMHIVHIRSPSAPLHKHADSKVLRMHAETTVQRACREVKKSGAERATNSSKLSHFSVTMTGGRGFAFSGGGRRAVTRARTWGLSSIMATGGIVARRSCTTLAVCALQASGPLSRITKQALHWAHQRAQCSVQSKCTGA